VTEIRAYTAELRKEMYVWPCLCVSRCRHVWCSAVRALHICKTALRAHDWPCGCGHNMSLFCMFARTGFPITPARAPRTSTCLW
jgi:hypothetical protein